MIINVIQPVFAATAANGTPSSPALQRHDALK
jgi:hypothetical protein